MIYVPYIVDPDKMCGSILLRSEGDDSFVLLRDGVFSFLELKSVCFFSDI